MIAILIALRPYVLVLLSLNVGFIFGMWLSRALLCNIPRPDYLTRANDSLANPNNKRRYATWIRRLQLN